MDMTITIGKKEYSFNSYEIAHEYIKSAIDSKIDSELMLDLAGCNSIDILETIAESDDIQLDVFKKLVWERSSRVIEALIRYDKFKEFVTKEDLDIIITSMPYETLLDLAQNLEDLPKDLIDYTYQKLKLLNIKEINYRLAQNRQLPMNYLKELAENEDISVSKEARENLKMLVEYF